jgi:hypothetical protein
MLAESASAQRKSRQKNQRTNQRKTQGSSQRTPQRQSQQKKDTSKLALIRGKAIHALDKYKGKIDIRDIKTSLHQEVMPPDVPVPKNWLQMNIEDQRQWAETFKKSDQGKRFLKNREDMIANAPTFEVIYEESGEFVVYDVPSGTYGLQGRFDKEVDGKTVAFEVFAKIVVEKGVQILDLQPIPIEVTPLFKAGQAAPKIDVETYDGKDKLTLATPSYQDKYVFVNFWFTGDQGQEYQKQVQAMYGELKEKYPIKLLSICVDEKRGAAIKFIVKAKYKLGSHGFTDGWDHSTIENYGVRSTPSGWLIGPDRKIAMTQHEFYQAVKIKPTITDVIRDRIEGKDKPTPAARPEDSDEPTEDAKVRTKNSGSKNVRDKRTNAGGSSKK